MIDLNTYDHTAGSQVIEFLATFIAAVVSSGYVLSEKRSLQITSRKVLRNRPLRILLGGSIEMYARAAGTLSYLPAWPMLSGGQVERTAAYTSWIAPLPIAAGFLTALGLAVIFWPAIHRRFGKASCGVVTAFVAAIYFAAAWGNSIIGRWS